MKRTAQFQAVAIFALAIIAISFGCKKSSDYSMVGGGSSGGGNGWWFSSGSIFLQPDEPGVLIGMQKTPGGNRELSYVVLFRHTTSDSRRTRHDRNSSTGYNGKVAKMVDMIAIDGNQFELKLEIETDHGAGTIASTKITVNGKDVDLSKGTIFLVDLTSDSVPYNQVKATYAGELPDPKETETVTKLARQLTQHFGSVSKEVSEFLSK